MDVSDIRREEIFMESLIHQWQNLDDIALNYFCKQSNPRAPAVRRPSVRLACVPKRGIRRIGVQIMHSCLVLDHHFEFHILLLLL